MKTRNKFGKAITTALIVGAAITATMPLASELMTTIGGGKDTASLFAPSEFDKFRKKSGTKTNPLPGATSAKKPNTAKAKNPGTSATSAMTADSGQIKALRREYDKKVRDYHRQLDSVLSRQFTEDSAVVAKHEETIKRQKAIIDSLNKLVAQGAISKETAKSLENVISGKASASDREKVRKYVDGLPEGKFKDKLASLLLKAEQDAGSPLPHGI